MKRTPRARVVVLNEDGEVLLLQVWPNTAKWSLPGGGVHSDERPEDAASRELKEETGMNIRPDEIHTCFSMKDHGHEEIVFRANASKESLPPTPPNRWEVRRAAWHRTGSLPDVSPKARSMISEVVEGR